MQISKAKALLAAEGLTNIKLQGWDGDKTVFRCKTLDGEDVSASVVDGKVVVGPKYYGARTIAKEITPHARAVQVRITGTSGYAFAEEEYSDVLTITEHFISYDCKPYEPSDINPVQTWSYSTNSPAFKKLFELIVSAIHGIFEKDPQCPGTDMPSTRFLITYENNKTTEIEYFCSKNEFTECFSHIKKMVPPDELMPWVLQTSEDFRKRRIWHDIMGM